MKRLFGLLIPVVMGAFGVAEAHCDTLDGPVVANARAALEQGNVTPVLKWVHVDDEAAIRAAFARALAVRALSPESKALADTWFFETLVRVHRAGEGAPFTGLKPAGSEVDPAVQRADAALAGGSADSLVSFVSTEVAGGIRKRFQAVVEKKKRADESVAAGREYVEAYVDYVHYVERVQKSVAPSEVESEEAHAGHAH